MERGGAYHKIRLRSRTDIFGPTFSSRTDIFFPPVFNEFRKKFLRLVLSLKNDLILSPLGGQEANHACVTRKTRPARMAL